MKPSVRLAVMSAAVLGLAACATTEEATSYVPAHKVQSTRLQSDAAYMARVEAIARRRGIDLTWVNPPKKIVVKEEQEDNE